MTIGAVVTYNGDQIATDAAPPTNNAVIEQNSGYAD